MNNVEHCELEQKTIESAKKMGISHYELNCPLRGSCSKGHCRFALTEDELLSGLFHRHDYDIRKI